VTVIWHYKSTAHDRRERLRAIQKRVDAQNKVRDQRKDTGLRMRHTLEKRDALNDMKSLVAFLEASIDSIEKDSCPIRGPDACPVCASAIEVARQFYSQAK